MRSILSLAAPSLLAACSAVPAAPTATEAAPADVGARSAWSAVVTARLRAGARAVRPDEGGGFVATVAGGTARFSPAAVHVEAGETTVSLRFAGWGRDGALRGGAGEPVLGACAGATEVDARGDCVRRLEIARDGGVEWWAGRADGLWQGWDLAERPEGDGPVRIAVAVEGAELVDDGDEVRLFDAVGRMWRYGELRAWDADDVELPVDVSVEGDRIVLTVDDAGAAWPLVVDPVLSSPTTRVTEGGETGYAVAGAGDVDGDGYDDVIVGAPYLSSTTSNSGSAFVYHGSATGVSTSASTQIDGVCYACVLGAAVAGAGDVNADGYDDVIVGSLPEGKAYVHHGSAVGVSSTAATELDGGASGFGGAVAGAGDVNADGYDDVIVGDVYDGTGGASAGRAFVYHGSATGISTSYARAITGTSGAYLGYSVAGAGDVNGDGYDDIVVGAPFDASPGYAYAGAAYLHLGSATGVVASSAWSAEGAGTGRYVGYSVAWAGDLNGDGYAELAVGSTYHGTLVFHGSGSGPSATADATIAGYYEGAAAGDVNGDGYGDLVVGLDGYAHVHHGSAAGVDTTAATTLSAPASSSAFGFSVAGAGDVDADGFADIVVGAHTEGYYAGAAYVYHGYAQDDDGDGLGVDVDCDDGDATVSAASTWYADADGDGYGDGYGGGAGVSACTAPVGHVADATDCDDSSALVSPAGVEVCNGADDDCDGTADDDATDASPWYADADGDGYGAGSPVASCAAPADHVANADDCDDTSGRFNPAASEADCDDPNDYNCDGSVAYDDADADGWAACEDCDDADSDVSPDGTEVCNEADDDCDGIVDERVTITLYTDADGDGWGDPAAPVEGCGEGPGAVADANDCDDAAASVHPGASDVAGDGIDQDCDGADAAASSDDTGGTDDSGSGPPDGEECPDDGCGCATPATPGAAIAAVSALLAALGARRRR